MKELQIEIDAARDNKREFEYRTNKECMKKTQIIEDYKIELQKVDYDLKICNAKLNALHSSKNIDTGRLNSEFEQLLERSMNDIDKNSHEVKETDISLEQFNKAYDDTIKISLDNNLENTENKKHYEDIENKIDLMMNLQEDLVINQELVENEKKDEVDKILDTDDNKEKESNDKVRDMFSKEPEMLEEYKNFENDANFKFTSLSNDKNKDSTINI